MRFNFVYKIPIFPHLKISRFKFNSSMIDKSSEISFFI
ncbi:hypothetical protein CAMSH0001_2096 [Campylobacter showae RM3277]|uniref:Uncharacterized protein n=1 Tax=Campylobacter showae RM3277 TaxID=553219 RepID=C6REK4_9BACT|nr:hypothetical protein CAMSH0001_2096 [Campylobacter showae RM3277]